KFLYLRHACIARIATQPFIAGHARRSRHTTHFGDGVPGMTGAALPLPARIIRTTFIADKCAFWSFRHGLPRYFCAVCAPGGADAYPAYKSRPLFLINAAGENTEHPHQISMTDSHFRLFLYFWLGMVGDAQPGNFDH